MKKYIFLMLIATAMLLYKVYLANQIYLTSRDIQKIAAKVDALKEEKNILKLKIEKLKYQTTIIDPLFNYEPKKRQIDTKTNPNNDLAPIKEDNTKEKSKPKKAKELFKKIDKELF